MTSSNPINEDDDQLPILNGVAPRHLPAFVEQFLGTIRAGPCGGGSDFTDARYAIDRALPVITSGSTPAMISTVKDTLSTSISCITATNLAELSAGSHQLSAGTTVYIFGVINHAGLRQYVFNQPVAGGGCVVQISSAASGGGKYNGHILSGVSGAVASGTLSMPEGLTTGATCLILNEEEDGQSGHRLATSSYAVGQIVGSSAGTSLVMIRGALGSTSSTTALSGSGTSADSGTWSRAGTGTPVSIPLQTRTVWDSTGGVLYGFQRTLTFDARGLLISVSAETQVTIDTPTACT